jgi:hypothetical protein
LPQRQRAKNFVLSLNVLNDFICCHTPLSIAKAQELFLAQLLGK